MVLYKLLVDFLLEYGTIFTITSLISYFAIGFWKDIQKKGRIGKNKSSIKANKPYPPGPRGIPIFGYLPFLSYDAHLDFLRLRDKYGSIFSIKLGSSNVVV